ncbi:unnamed protein product [Amoebophrya sp. A25]|nr:unnamed protein product [Amoebophrya sp. A25]|eukprot:GSA25T00025905001.1
MDFPDLQREWRAHEGARRRFFNLRRFLVNYAMEGTAQPSVFGETSDLPAAPIPAGDPASRRRTTVKRRSFSVIEDLARQEEESQLPSEEKKYIVINAVEQGKVNKIRAYLQNAQLAQDKTLWNMRNKNGDTPLLVAIKDRDLQMMHLLCSNWPTLELGSTDRPQERSAVHLLVLMRVEDDIIQFFLNHADLSAVDRRGWGIVHFCAFAANKDILERLKDAGYFDYSSFPASGDGARKVLPPHRLNLRNKDGSTGNAQQHHTEVTSTSQQSKKAKPKTRSPLRGLQRYGTLAAIPDQESDAEISDEECGADPMESLAEKQHSNDDDFAESLATASLKLLGSYGAEKRRKVDQAREKVEEEVQSAFSFVASDPLPPLHIAAAGGHADVCLFLIHECSQAVTEQSLEGGKTPLHCACHAGHPHIVKLLLHAIDEDKALETPDSNGWAPLHFLAWSGLQLVSKQQDKMGDAHFLNLSPSPRTGTLGTTWNKQTTTFSPSSRRGPRSVGTRVLTQDAWKLSAVDIARKKHLTGWLLNSDEHHFASGTSSFSSSGNVYGNGNGNSLLWCARCARRVTEKTEEEDSDDADDKRDVEMVSGGVGGGGVGGSGGIGVGTAPRSAGGVMIKNVTTSNKMHTTTRSVSPNKKTTTAAISMLCKKCHLVHYCSKKCQQADWPAHKRECREFRERAAEELANASLYALNNR